MRPPPLLLISLVFGLNCMTFEGQMKKVNDKLRIHFVWYKGEKIFQAYTRTLYFCQFILSPLRFTSIY